MKKLLSAILIMLISNISYAAALKISPEQIRLPKEENTFKIEVLIENVINLGGFMFDIKYDPDTVIIENAQKGGFLGDTAEDIILSIDNENGLFSFGQFSYEGVSGSGTLAIITFILKNRAVTKLNLENTETADSDGQPIQTDIKNSEIIPVYKITAESEAGGNISPSGEITVEHGTDKTFVITPDICYFIKDVIADGNSEGAENERTFFNITADHSIKAGFSHIPAPDVTTDYAESVSCHSAKLNGTVNPEGFDTIYYFEYGMTESYGFTSPEIYAGSGNENISVNADIDDLKAETVYHFRLAGRNNCGINYGQDKVFELKPEIPVIATAKVTSVTQNSGIARGMILEDGGVSIIARGICVGLYPNPSLENNNVIFTDTQTGTGEFKVTLTGLMPDTFYYVRAYASNSAGTAYGGEKTFKTEPAATAGDVNCDGILNLQDVIPALQVISAIKADEICLNADVNGDGQTGIEEVIYILRNIIK